jgi:hypothetical protein
MRRLELFTLLSIVILAGSPLLAADVTSISCGTEVVALGDSQNDVLAKCGDPSYTVGGSYVYETGFSGPKIVIHFGGSVFAPKVVRIEEVSETGAGDQP